jgi:hypothetical protein
MSHWIDDLIALRSVRKYVAYAGELEFMRASESDSAGRTVRFRLVRPPEQQSHAHPFAKCTRRRRGKGGSRFEVGFAAVDSGQEMLLEVTLLNWSSTPQGDWVDFALDFAADKHPFMGCSRASKEVPGTRWMATFVEKDDSEVLINQEKVARLEQTRRTGRGQTLSNVARMLTKHPRFHEWLREYEEDTDWNTQAADDWLKTTIGIQSKADLDNDGPEAVKAIAAFHRIRTKFVEWQETQGYDITE